MTRSLRGSAINRRDPRKMTNAAGVKEHSPAENEDSSAPVESSQTSQKMVSVEVTVKNEVAVTRSGRGTFARLWG